MSLNYDPYQVGVPYVRVHELTITWPDTGANQMPQAIAKQSIAVKLADGSIVTLREIDPLLASLDFTTGDQPIPLINPEDGKHIGIDTTLNQAMLNVLAVIRQKQIQSQ